MYACVGLIFNLIFSGIFGIIYIEKRGKDNKKVVNIGDKDEKNYL